MMITFNRENAQEIFNIVTITAELFWERICSHCPTDLALRRHVLLHAAAWPACAGRGRPAWGARGGCLTSNTGTVLSLRFSLGQSHEQHHD